MKVFPRRQSRGLMRPRKLRSWVGVAQDNIAVTDDHLCITFLYSRAASEGMEGIVALR